MPLDADLRDRVVGLVRADDALLVEMRRDLHMHPEISGQEHGTTQWLVQHLTDLGLAPRVLAIGTGVVCDVPLGSGQGPLVALRADIDALAMVDGKDVGYRSQNDGAAHACGHDVHTTAVLGAGRALVRLQGAVPDGVVRLVFEPSEEQVPGGAVDVIAEGFLDGVDAMFGLHCDPKVDVGRIGLRPGPISSASDMLRITVSGPGGHTSRPDRTIDLLRVMGQLQVGAQATIDRVSGEPGAIRMVFGAVSAGDAANVIPARGVLRGTVRTPDHDVWRELPAYVEATVAELLGPTGVEWELEHRRGVPPVVNDPESTDLVERNVRAYLGDDAVVEVEQSWGGDSYAWYLENVPGTYVRLGVHDPESGRPRLDLHAGTFDVDERAIGHGAVVLATSALDALGTLG